MKDLVNEYKMAESSRKELREAILASCEKADITTDIPLSPFDTIQSVSDTEFDEWVSDVSNYLFQLEERLFSNGLHTLGSKPTEKELSSYLNAYFNDRLSEDEIVSVINKFQKTGVSYMAHNEWPHNLLSRLKEFQQNFVMGNVSTSSDVSHVNDSEDVREAADIVSLLSKNTEELDSVICSLNGGYVLPAPGGDLLRDGTSVLPTGRNIHALDPYRMPSSLAWARGQNAVEEIIRQHQSSNDGSYPETVAVTLWGLDTIKTRGESIAIVLALVGARPVKEGTGRTVNFELIPLDELGRPRIDILASLSGIFRDSFANVVDLLGEFFKEMNSFHGLHQLFSSLML